MPRPVAHKVHLSNYGEEQSIHRALVRHQWECMYLGEVTTENSVTLAQKTETGTAICVRSGLSASVRPQGLWPPGSSVHGILQARILEWAATPSCRGSSQPRDRTLVCLLHR